MQTSKSIKPIITINGRNLKAMDIQIQLWKKKKEKQQLQNLPRKKITFNKSMLSFKEQRD